ncbi:MAG: hypothetical protein H7Z13_09165 [Ferruginibacter sp.]|nr:hypothetical protein [Ferruginibacter sp.]
MRNTIIFFIISLLAVSCGKDKYTTAPQIKYKSLSPNSAPGNITSNNPNVPIIVINVTDAEGDLGSKDGKESKIYIKNLLTSAVDSFPLPDIQSVSSKNFQADIRINTFSILRGSPRNPPKIDTLFYEIYVMDFAKNKSNVIKTGDPLFFVFP